MIEIPKALAVLLKRRPRISSHSMMSVFFSHKQQLSHATNPKISWFYQQLQTEADKPLELE